MPGEPDRSLLIRAVRHEGDLKMPPNKKLTGPQIDALVRWVRAGAADPRTGAVARGADPNHGLSHWAFQPLKVSAPRLPGRMISAGESSPQKKVA